MSTFFERISTIDRRIIYFFVFLTAAFPFFLHKSADVHITNEVRDVFAFVDSLPAGSRVVISSDYGPSSYPEVQPQVIAMLRHVFSRGHKVYLMTHWRFEGLIVGVQAITDVAREMGKKYGTDYVIWGFRPGIVPVIQALGDSIPAVFGADYRGTPINDYARLPVMRGFNNLKQASLVVAFAAGNSGDFWVVYGQSRDKYPLALGSTAVVTPDLYPYYNAHQIIGIIGGLKGAAEYERLVKRKGLASIGMVSQSAVHIFIMFAIFVGNLGFFFRRSS